jgi:hypothetical protein
MTMGEDTSALEVLRRHDPLLVELPCGAGGILITPTLQGRVFCHIGGELVHRLDHARLEQPSTTEFNNLGGNSLWPAPEGGAFAFNYPPDGGEWTVQRGIAETPCYITAHTISSVSIEKFITLKNRKGVRFDMAFCRNVRRFLAFPLVEGYDLDAVGYTCEDLFVPSNTVSGHDALIAPWSLEQFPGSDGIVAFTKVEDPKGAVNFDFYTHPGDRIRYGENFVTFELGGKDRHQIGVKVTHKPQLLGALDGTRSVLVIRRTPTQDGVYFNIADNDQPEGPFSAADMYSVFNGGALGFFELETIAPMQVREGTIATSRLVSETVIFKGPLPELKRYLSERAGICLWEEAT